MRASLYLFLLLSLSSARQVEYEIEINRAIDNLYNFKLDSCIYRLSDLSTKYPEDALVPFLQISAQWQKALLNESPESSYEVIYRGIERVEPFYAEMMDRYPKDPGYPLFLGSLHGLKSRIDLAQSNWFDLVMSGARGFMYIDQARQLDEGFYDVYMPIGTLEYFLCRSSMPLQIAGKVFGLESDCKEAVSKLEKASELSEFSWIESRNVLSYIYLYIERDYSKALETSSSIADNFPGHPFFAYLKAEALVRLERYDQFESYEKTLESFYLLGPENQRVECRAKHLYLKGLIAYQQGRYADAISFCDQVIDDYQVEFKWILGYAHLIRGKSTELASGRSAIVLSDYKEASNHLTHYPEYDEARHLMRRPIDEALDSK